MKSTKRLLSILMILIATMLVLTACGGDEDEAPAESAAAPTATEAPAATATFTPVPPTATSAPTATTEPTSEPTQSPLPTPGSDDARGADSPLATPPGRDVDSPLATPDTTLSAIIEAAKTQLAAEVEGLDVATIEVVSSEAVDWGDASLGCPQPGENYAQVVTRGYQIVLAANGQEYDMHTMSSADGRIVLCEEE